MKSLKIGVSAFAFLLVFPSPLKATQAAFWGEGCGFFLSFFSPLMLPHCLSGNAGEKVKDSGAGQNPSHKREKSGAQPIIVPIVLRMAEFDHKVVTLNVYSSYIISSFFFIISSFSKINQDKQLIQIL